MRRADGSLKEDNMQREHRAAERVLVLGYVSARGCARSDDPELRRQAAAIDRFCARVGWDLVEVVRDVEPAYGRRHRRPSLTYAIGRLQTGEASCLVVAEFDRLYPSVAELGEILDAVEQANARLISLDPALDTASRSGRAALRLLASVSRSERAKRAEMTFSARAQVAGLHTTPPKIKRQISRMRGAGMTLQAIADALNEEGVPTVRGGAKWRPSSVQTALGYKRPRPWPSAMAEDRMEPSEKAG
jgi:DNA invertase Pin-like site-specific DNA recombinase